MTSRKRPTLDLHGCTTDEVFNLLDQFIRDNNKYPELCVIVGKGKGLVKQKTISYLKGAHYPWRYERVRGIENEGALIVDLT